MTSTAQGWFSVLPLCHSPWGHVTDFTPLSLLRLLWCGWEWSHSYTLDGPVTLTFLSVVCLGLF